MVALQAAKHVPYRREGTGPTTALEFSRGTDGTGPHVLTVTIDTRSPDTAWNAIKDIHCC